MDKSLLIDSLRRQNCEESIISAFQKVRREDFLPEHLKPYAYEDIALPLEDGSTTSQPSTIAFMLSLLDLNQNQKVLEIGSGSGYVLALISEIKKSFHEDLGLLDAQDAKSSKRHLDIIKDGKIYGLEINKNLAVKSANILKKDSNVIIFNRSGSIGLPDFAPFDRILVSASFRDMRIPYQIAEQLKESGVLVAPVKSSIFKIKKTRGKLEEKEYYGFAFVPFKED